MESYRICSTLTEQDREYLIQTTNDAVVGSVSTTVFVNGTPAETMASHHPEEVSPQEILSLVKVTHSEKKKELELLLRAFRKVSTEGDSRTKYQLGTAFYHKGFLAEARQLFHAASVMSQDYHEAFNYLGLSELAMGRIDEAIKAELVAVAQRPGYADYHNNLGEMYLAKDDCLRASEEFGQSIKINLYYSDAYYNLGLCYLRSAVLHPDRSRIPDIQSSASNCFHKASLIYTSYKSPFFDEGMAELEQANFDKALLLFKRIRESKKDLRRKESASFYMRFVLHPDWVSDEAVADRIKYLEAEIHRNPSYVDLVAELAQSYLEQARLDWQKGIDQYQRSLSLNPSLGRVTDALEACEGALELMNRTIGSVSENSGN